MVAYVFETTVPAPGVPGASSSDMVDPLRDVLKSISGDAYELDPLTADPATGFSRVAAGTTKFMWGFPFDSAVPGAGLLFNHPFGMESQEMLSWWYKGGGAAAFAAELLAAGEDVVAFPIARLAESSGWYKEPMTLNKFLSGKYASGEQIKFRLFGTPSAIHLRAFPLVSLPPATPATSPLADMFLGTFNGGEGGDPLIDASIFGFFPNWPTVGGSVVEAFNGAAHYYVGPWHTPNRFQMLWVNKTFYDALTAQQKDWITVAAERASLQNLAQSLEGGDALLTTMQGLTGLRVYGSLPRTVLERLRGATEEILDEEAAADGTGAYQNILDSMRNHIKANQFVQRVQVDRKWRHRTTRLQGTFEPTA